MFNVMNLHTVHAYFSKNYMKFPLPYFESRFEKSKHIKNKMFNHDTSDLHKIFLRLP